MYACAPETGRGFFEGVRSPSDATAHLHDPPPPGGQATRLNNALSGLLSRFAEEIGSIRVRAPACGFGNFLSVSMQRVPN